MLWFNKLSDILCNLINVSNIFFKKLMCKKIDKYIDKYIDNYIDKTENIQDEPLIKKVTNSIEDMLFFYDDEPITF